MQAGSLCYEDSNCPKNVPTFVPRLLFLHFEVTFDVTRKEFCKRGNLQIRDVLAGRVMDCAALMRENHKAYGEKSIAFFFFFKMSSPGRSKMQPVCLVQTVAVSKPLQITLAKFLTISNNY